MSTIDRKCRFADVVTGIVCGRPTKGVPMCEEHRQYVVAQLDPKKRGDVSSGIIKKPPRKDRPPPTVEMPEEVSPAKPPARRPTPPADNNHWVNAIAVAFFGIMGLPVMAFLGWVIVWKLHR